MIARITITLRIIATGIAMRSELCDLSSLDEICSTTEKKKDLHLECLWQTGGTLIGLFRLVHTKEVHNELPVYHIILLISDTLQTPTRCLWVLEILFWILKVIISCQFNVLIVNYPAGTQTSKFVSLFLYHVIQTY